MSESYLYEVVIKGKKYCREIKNTEDLLAMNELISLIGDFCDNNNLKLDYGYRRLSE